MSNKYIVYGIVVVMFSLYFGVYYYLRSDHYMIHRSNTHDEHWITLGEYNTSIHLFADDPADSANRTESNRRFWFAFFWPARKIEEFYQNYL